MKKISVFRVFVIIFLYSLAANFAHPITPTFIQVLGLHDYMFGVAFACMSATNFLFSPFWGKLSEKHGGGFILSFCLLGYGVMQVFFGLSTSEWQICLARLFGGFFISGISVSQLIYIMKNSNQVGKDLAIAATINMVISPFGFLIGGFLGDWNLLGTFIIQGVCLFACGILGFIIVGDSQKEDVKLKREDINPFKAFVNAKDIINSLIIIFLVIACISSFASTSYEQCFNYYIKDIFGFPSSYNGILKAGVGFVALIANWTITMKLLKTNTFKTIIPVFFLLFAMLVGICILDDMIPFIVLNVVFFGMNSIYLPILQDMMTKYKTKNDGELVGLFNAVRSLGMVFGSLLAGFIYEAGPKLSFVVSAIGFGLCVILAIRHYKQTNIKLKA